MPKECPGCHENECVSTNPYELCDSCAESFLAEFDRDAMIQVEDYNTDNAIHALEADNAIPGYGQWEEENTMDVDECPFNNQ